VAGWLLAACGTVLAQAPAAAPAGLDITKEKIAFGVTNTPQSGIFLTRVWPEKLLFFRADTIAGTVDLVNTSAVKRQVLVRAHVTRGLDRPAGAQERKADLEPFGRASVALRWPAKDVGLYGHAMVAEVLEGGTSLARGEEFFGVSTSVWEIAISGNHPMGFTADAVKDMAGVDARAQAAQ